MSNLLAAITRSMAPRLLAAAFGLLPSTAAAQTPRPQGVVELFTSEGCSSCPPADAVLAELARSGEVVALAYHVDYWDYLGWKDTLGSAMNTARQRRYAKALHSSRYTPQAVVNGRAHFEGWRGAAVRGAIRSMAKAGKGLSVDVSLSKSPDSIVIDIGDATAPADTANVVLVSFIPETSIAIRRGENRGETIDYVNAVTDFRAVGIWRGKAKRIELPRSAMQSKGCAVLLQAADERSRPGPILGAAMIR